MLRFLVASCVSGLLGACPATADGLHVVDAYFSTSAQPRSDPPPSARLHDRAPRQVPLYFWSKIAGDSNALADISAAEELPVRHVWTVRCFSTSDPANDDVTFESEEDIFVGQSKELDKGKWATLIAALKRETAENARRRNSPIFDWRTQSRKMAVEDCTYTVRIADRSGEDLWCDNIKDKCEFSLTLSQ